MRTRRAMHAIPRAGQPEEIGAAAAYLASDAAAFMTGQCLTLDGGIRCGDLLGIVCHFGKTSTECYAASLAVGRNSRGRSICVTLCGCRLHLREKR